MTHKIRLHWNSSQFIHRITVYEDASTFTGFTWYEITFYNPDLFHNIKPYIWYSNIKNTTSGLYHNGYPGYKDWSEV